MSDAVISKSAFILEPKKEGAYELQIQFLGSHDDLISTRNFIFTPQGPKATSKEEGKVSFESTLQGDELLDVYSQNGECSSPEKILKNLFSKRDIQDASAAGSVLKTSGFKGPTILVLDLKDHDPTKGYKERTTIEKCEDVVCEFFKRKALEGPAKAVQFKSTLTPDFVLCEGRLKVDLLKCGGFTASEIEYFHTRSGATSLCQTAEFFMNAFKFGEKAVGEKGELLAERYIVPVSGRFSSFQPCTTSTVLYPPPYAKIYAVDGVYAKTIGTVFNVKGGVDAATKITTMSVARKV